MLGKVEAITFFNTRVKTFDGKTFFVPKRQILNAIVINYHFSKTRKIKINVGIRYDEDRPFRFYDSGNFEIYKPKQIHGKGD